MKRFFKWTIVIIILSFINLGYYTFIGSQRSLAKLTNNQELSFYECCSIYQLHTSMWMFGWILYPEAAHMARLMHFKHDETVVIHNRFFMESQRVREVIWDLKPGEGKKVKWTAADYRTSEYKYALTLNCPCTVYSDPTNCGTYIAENYVHYEDYVNTIYVGKHSFKLHQSLFKYLQDKGWLFTYKLYWTS